MVRPKADIDTLLRIRYTCPELGPDEIRAIFGDISSGTMSRLRRMAREKQKERGIHTIGTYTVSTSAAYEAWGINVEFLKQGRKELIKLGLYDQSAKEA